MNKNHYHIPKLRLDIEYEHVNILRTTNSATRNEFGEPTKTTVTSAINAHADIHPMTLLSSQQLAMFEQGLVKIATHWCMVTAGTTISERNQILDEDGNIFDVVQSQDYLTHKEALLRKAE